MICTKKIPYGMSLANLKCAANAVAMAFFNGAPAVAKIMKMITMIKNMGKIKRPNIKDFMPECTDLYQAINEFEKSPVLFSYVKALDRYIDSLEDAISEDENDEENNY